MNMAAKKGAKKKKKKRIPGEKVGGIFKRERERSQATNLKCMHSDPEEKKKGEGRSWSH